MESQTHDSAAVLLASGGFWAQHGAAASVDPHWSRILSPDGGERASPSLCNATHARAGHGITYARSATCAKARSAYNEACTLIMQAIADLGHQWAQEVDPYHE